MRKSHLLIWCIDLATDVVTGLEKRRISGRESRLGSHNAFGILNAGEAESMFHPTTERKFGKLRAKAFGKAASTLNVLDWGWCRCRPLSVSAWHISEIVGAKWSHCFLWYRIRRVKPCHFDRDRQFDLTKCVFCILREPCELTSNTAYAECLNVRCVPWGAAPRGHVKFPNTSSASLNGNTRCKTVFFGIAT